MDEPGTISDAERIKEHEEQIANLKQANERLSESRQRLVADITSERQLYETQIKRLEIQNKALMERMQPFLKQEEANTVAGQLKEWERIRKIKAVPMQPKQQSKHKKRTKRHLHKESRVLKSTLVVDTVATHLL